MSSYKCCGNRPCGYTLAIPGPTGPTGPAGESGIPQYGGKYSGELGSSGTIMAGVYNIILMPNDYPLATLHADGTYLVVEEPGIYLAQYTFVIKVGHEVNFDASIAAGPAPALLTPLPETISYMEFDVPGTKQVACTSIITTAAPNTYLAVGFLSANATGVSYVIPAYSAHLTLLRLSCGGYKKGGCLAAFRPQTKGQFRRWRPAPSQVTYVRIRSLPGLGRRLGLGSFLSVYQLVDFVYKLKAAA